MVRIRRGRRIITGIPKTPQAQVSNGIITEDPSIVRENKCASTTSEESPEKIDDVVPLASTSTADPPLTVCGMDSASEVKEVTGESLIGREVRKRFGKRNYMGQVESFDPDTKWYWVKYSDGDQEELDWEELKGILLPHNQDQANKSNKCAKSKK